MSFAVDSYLQNAWSCSRPPAENNITSPLPREVPHFKMAFVSGVSVSLRASSFTKAAVSARSAAPVARWSMSKSSAVPFLDAPPALDGVELSAGVQFDPLGFSNKWDLKFLQEAEIK